MNETLRRFLAFFLPAAVVTASLAFLTYAAVQQDLRQGANDPQEQLAEDAVAALNKGAAPESVVPPTGVNVTASLSPFVAVYAADGTDLATNGSIDGNPPAPPKGVLDAARSTGRDAVTWQPKDGVRIATVVLPWHGGTVLAGRSLRRVENLESQIEALIGLVGLATIAVAAVASFISARVWPTRVSGAT